MPGRPEPFNLGYRPALDGLRAVAVLAVMVYHSGLIRGGFLGVDVFFTLSGFLITTLLLEEYARTGTLSVGRFYIRRALRLLPALVVFLMFWGGVILTRIPAEDRPVLGGYLLGVLGYVANWLYIYWRPLGVFSHTWSLAIEEQFYLVWPVMLFLLLRWVRHAPWIVAGLVTAAVGSLVWRLALALVADASLSRIYLGTDTHADGLLIGAAVAVWLRHHDGWSVRGFWRHAGVACFGLGLLGLLLATPLIPGYVWGVTVLTALATSVMICDILAGSSRVTRWLEATWLVSLGRISYGLYLWHWPVFFQFGALVHPGDSAAPVGYIALAWSLTFTAALCSYVLIERPCLAYKARLRANPEIEPAPAAVVPPTTENGGHALPASR